MSQMVSLIFFAVIWQPEWKIGQLFQENRSHICKYNMTLKGNYNFHEKRYQWCNFHIHYHELHWLDGFEDPRVIKISLLYICVVLIAQICLGEKNTSNTCIWSKPWLIRPNFFPLFQWNFSLYCVLPSNFFVCFIKACLSFYATSFCYV